jgi:L,D-transpeptidase catalytic domain
MWGVDRTPQKALLVAAALALAGAATVLALRGGSDPPPRTVAAPADEPPRAVADARPGGAGNTRPGAGSDARPGAGADARPGAGADAQPATQRERRPVLSERGEPLVWVRRGHEVGIHAAPGGPVVRTVGDETEFGSPRAFWVARTEGRWGGVPNPFTGNGTLGWIRLDPRELRAGYTVHEIVVDLSDRRAELYRRGEVVRAFTVSIGAPGTNTPRGRFAVTDTFRGDLHPAYGCCAVAFTAVQPNLPSGWLGGNRIAIHGTSGPLGAAISSGCVRAADRDVSALVRAVPPGAPVTVRE